MIDNIILILKLSLSSPSHLEGRAGGGVQPSGNASGPHHQVDCRLREQSSGFPRSVPDRAGGAARGQVLLPLPGRADGEPSERRCVNGIDK